MGKKETPIEREFVKRIRADFNVRAIKFKDPSRRGGPDRLVILPSGCVKFFEFKAPGEALRADQEDYHTWLRTMRHTVHTCYSADEAYSVVKVWLSRYFGGMA